MKAVSSEETKTALKQLLILSINFLGFVGAALIVYSIVAAATSSGWPILDEIATTVSVYATLIGTLLTASSVYLPTNTRDPDPVSTVFTARIVILGVVAAFGYIWVGDGTLPPHLINGFAILAISGALFRLLSR